MRIRQAVLLETLRRSQAFLDDHASELGDLAPIKARQQLDDCVTTLTNESVAQEAATRESLGETRRHRSLRQELLAYKLRPIVVVARRRSKEFPQLKGLTMPRSRVNSGLLVTAALGIVDAAEPHADLLVEGGIPHNFLTTVRATAQALAKSIEVRNAHRAKRSGSTAALEAEEKHGRSILALFDSFLLPAIADSNLAAEWKNARRIPRKPGPTHAANTHTGSADTSAKMES